MLSEGCYLKEKSKMINSDVIWITTINPSNRQEIEEILTREYGKLIRWAIVDVIDKQLKICLTYEKTGS